jgi:hypothetical protein
VVAIRSSDHRSAAVGMFECDCSRQANIRWGESCQRAAGANAGWNAGGSTSWIAQSRKESRRSIARWSRVERGAEVKELSYRFTREMARAVLDGRKTMTRRPIILAGGWDVQPNYAGECWPVKRIGAKLERMPCPYGDPGDTFRLSETVHVRAVDHERYSLLFEADLLHTERYGTPELMERIRNYKRGMLRGVTLPPAFCRSQRWEITRRWAERIQDISEEDAIAEGCQCAGVPTSMTNRGAFAKLWQSIYGPESWARNDWVWCAEWKAT